MLRAVVDTLLAAPVEYMDASTNSSHAKARELGFSRFLRDHVINACTAHGQTPLILACEQGCALCFFLLPAFTVSLCSQQI